MNRCCNNYFGYCADPSNIKTAIYRLVHFNVGGSTHETDEIGAACDKDPKTCGHYQTFGESVEALLPMTSKG